MRVSLRRTLTMTAACVSAVCAVCVLPMAAAAPARTPAPLPALAPLLGASAPNAIPGEYIVTLTPGSDPARVAHDAGVTPHHLYQDAMLGFSAPLTEPQLAQVRALPQVRKVEQDTKVALPPQDRVPSPPRRLLPRPGAAPGHDGGHGTDGRTGPAATDAELSAPGIFWGLERISHRTPHTHGFTVKATGSKVTAYIIDSGIDFAHDEFGGRATPGIDEIGDGLDGEDCAGHGTHVAGTVGGAHAGIAREVRLVSVRVLDCDAAGPNSGIIAGINWLARNAVKPAVANVSLGGMYSPAMNDALDGLARAGVFPVVAAGNDDINSCVISPASATEAFTVAATDQADHLASFSNFGSCVNLTAPGVDIASAWPDGSYAMMSGTSMAAPHVTGIAALYKDTYGDAPFDVVKKWLIAQATPNASAGAPWGTPTLLAFTGDL
ncbi:MULTISPECIES: S8 family serine peptidase [unclassified Streptomyces]|uniref:S8 family peptidase n=1 Tax=unclassified Streptomyces TaxID=2593676 RepID=UPI003809E78B